MHIDDENVMNVNGPMSLKMLEWFIRTVQTKGSAALIGVVPSPFMSSLTEVALMALRPHVAVFIPPTLPKKVD